MHPDDAAALGVGDGDSVTVKNASGSFAAPVKVTAAVQPRTLDRPSYFDGGAPAALFDTDSPVATVEVTRA